MKLRVGFLILLVASIAIGILFLPKKPMSRREAIQLTSSIKKGMSFQEIKSIVSTFGSRKMIREHGGTWYSFPVSSQYELHLRFSKDPSESPSTECLLNYPARLKDRATKALVYEAIKEP